MRVPNKSLIKIIVIFILSLLLIWVSWYVFYSRYIKHFGIELVPSQDFQPKEVIYYLQSDPLWGADNIGNSSYKMAGSGCLITSISVAMNDLGISITPKELNFKFYESGVYTDDGDVIWKMINKAENKIDYSYKRIFSAKTIENDLKNGLLPLVFVQYHGKGVDHWILIVGAFEGEFLIYDPINGKLDYLPLSTHGKVYAYRVIVLT